MESTHKYLTGMILAIAAIVFGGMVFLRGAVKTYNQIDPDISYSMPRPKTKNALYTWLFGLEGREIQYNEVDPFKGQAANANKAAGAAGSVRKDQKGAPKIDPKKAAKNALANTPIPVPKKPEVKVNVVNAKPEDPLRGSADGDAGQTPPGGAAAAAAAAQAANANNTQNDTALSPAQWRALLVAQPTKENVDKLVAAFNKKEVDSGTVYLIMNDLLQSSNGTSQAAGLSIAQSVPSLQSFSAVANNYDKLSPGSKPAADSYFQTYMQSSRLSILALALKSGDTEVVQHAVQTMVTGLQNVKSGGAAANDPRPSRGVVSTGKTNAYTQFIPILQQLSQGSDGSVAGLAQNALTQIQALPNV
jgi:hypothetical protein